MIARKTTTWFAVLVLGTATLSVACTQAEDDAAASDEAAFTGVDAGGASCPDPVAQHGTRETALDLGVIDDGKDATRLTTVGAILPGQTVWFRAKVNDLPNLKAKKASWISFDSVFSLEPRVYGTPYGWSNGLRVEVSYACTKGSLTSVDCKFIGTRPDNALQHGVPSCPASDADVVITPSCTGSDESGTLYIRVTRSTLSSYDVDKHQKRAADREAWGHERFAGACGLVRLNVR